MSDVSIQTPGDGQTCNVFTNARNFLLINVHELVRPMPRYTNDLLPVSRSHSGFSKMIYLPHLPTDFSMARSYNERFFKVFTWHEDIYCKMDDKLPSGGGPAQPSVLWSRTFFLFIQGLKKIFL